MDDARVTEAAEAAGAAAPAEAGQPAAAGAADEKAVAAAADDSREAEALAARRAKRLAERTKKKRRRALIKGWLAAAAAVVLALAVIFACFTDVRFVAGGGMAPALESGDAVLISRVARYISGYSRGDVIVYRDGEALLMARIIALGGETARVKEGSVYINGLLLNEAGFTSGRAADSGDIAAAKNQFVVLPDARDGVAPALVDEREIVGTVRMICYPLYRTAWFPSA